MLCFAFFSLLEKKSFCFCVLDSLLYFLLRGGSLGVNPAYLPMQYNEGYNAFGRRKGWKSVG